MASLLFPAQFSTTVKFCLFQKWGTFFRPSRREEKRRRNDRYQSVCTSLFPLFASLSSCPTCRLLHARSLRLHFLFPSSPSCAALPPSNRGTRIVPSCVFGHSHTVYLFQHFRCTKCVSKYRSENRRRTRRAPRFASRGGVRSISKINSCTFHEREFTKSTCVWS